MSFELLERARRNIGIRLGFWYAVVFALAGFALLAIAYSLLAAAIGSKDREVLAARLRDYATLYQTAGPNGLRRAVQQEQGSQQTFFIRLMSAWNDVSFVNVPDDWITFKDIPDDWAGYRRQIGVVRIPKNAERDFVIASAVLARQFAAASGPHHRQPHRLARAGPTTLHRRRDRGDPAEFRRGRPGRAPNHAAGPPDCGYRAFHHSDRSTRCPRARSGHRR